MNRLLKLFLSRDRLGHSFSLNYGGSEMHATKLGALISVTIQLLVAILLVQKSIEVVDMNDPTVEVLSRPLFKEEVEDFGVINVDEYRFNIGMQFFQLDDEGDTVPLDVPESIGRFVSWSEWYTYFPLVNCTGVFKGVNEELDEHE